ncbi:MAG: hypothetical protein P4M08_05565, partial [Oligoflexia bacterium]|nr:hypothetical protein [Oligoflexia bacterium]
MTTPRKKRLSVYLRTSGKTQEREETIERQILNFHREWPRLKDTYEIVPRIMGATINDPEQCFFMDPGYNLEKWDERRAVHDLISVRVPLRQVDAIFLSETDRLLRSRSDELRGRISDAIRRYNIVIETKTGTVSPGLALGLLSTIGAEDKKNILLKTQEGKITRAERDNRPPSGKIPFGYKFIKRTGLWEVVEEEKHTILCAAALMTGIPVEGMPPEVAALVQSHPEGLPDPDVVAALNAA